MNKEGNLQLQSDIRGKDLSDKSGEQFLVGFDWNQYHQKAIELLYKEGIKLFPQGSIVPEKEGLWLPEPNALIKEQYGMFLVDKPEWLSSHDIVNFFRKKFGVKKVGHAGALDPFATGLLIILVGKRCTKLTNIIIKAKKEYIFRVLFGLSTDTGDTEGIVTGTQKVKLTKKKIKEALFKGLYDQKIPMRSNTKIKGKKLREMKEAPEEQPTKKVKIYEMKLLDTGDISINKQKYFWADVVATVSSGTYVRQLSEDIGEKLNVPATTLVLRRTKVWV